MVEFRLAVALASLIALVAVLADVGYAKDAVVAAIEKAPKPVGSDRLYKCVYPSFCGYENVKKTIKHNYECYRYKHSAGCKFVGYFCYKTSGFWKCFPVYRCTCIGVRTCKFRVPKWCLKYYECLNDKLKYAPLPEKDMEALNSGLTTEALADE